MTATLVDLPLNNNLAYSKSMIKKSFLRLAPIILISLGGNLVFAQDDTAADSRAKYNYLFDSSAKKEDTSTQNLPGWEDTTEGKKFTQEYEAKKKAKEEEQKMLEKMSYYEQQRYLRQKKDEESSSQDDGNKDPGTNYNSGDF